MSRSIHATRRDLSLERNAERRDRLTEQLWRKRQIKSAQPSRRRETPTRSRRAIDATPLIVAIDEGPLVQYPATVADIEALIARLPSRALDGVGVIELSLGARAQRHRADRGGHGDVDPLTGRRGFERLPGIFCGGTLGQYLRGPNRIRVFGFVSATRLSDAPHWELYLRLHMLATFLHEAGHHLDLTRSARGRGSGETREDGEIYAERHEYAWARRYAVPYLEHAYPDEVASLLAWIKEHGGCALPLGALAGTASTVRGGLLRADAIFGGVPQAVEHLAEAVAAGEDRKATRLGFARELHYGERYALALGIVEQVHAQHPGDLEALTLEADLLEHLERYDEAERLLRSVLERDPRSLEAWNILSLVLQDQERWGDMLAAEERCLELATNAWERGFHRAARAKALIKLGQTALALAEIETLEQSGGNAGVQARRLRALLG
jgi:tetratricopeptide (TPR) repeat protein